MISLRLNIKDEAYEKVMYLINSLPKQDVQIVKKSPIEEIEPTTLPKEDFDYISEQDIKKIDEELSKAKEEGFENLKSFSEFKDEL